jgi:hypothetical protein
LKERPRSLILSHDTDYKWSASRTRTFAVNTDGTKEPLGKWVILYNNQLKDIEQLGPAEVRKSIGCSTVL